jgi:hypothetical protein
MHQATTGGNFQDVTFYTLTSANAGYNNSSGSTGAFLIVTIGIYTPGA